jgi:hypothetical protein
MTPRPALRSRPARLTVVAAVALAAGMLTLLPGGSPRAAAAGLVPFPDCDTLLAHHRTELSRSATSYGIEASGGAYLESGDLRAAGGDSPGAASAPTAASAATGDAVGTGSTGTNLQEPGVDEPDSAKLTGDLLVAAAAGRLQVLRAGPAPELLSSLPLGDGSSGAELLVEGDRVLVIAGSWRPAPGSPRPLPTDPMPVDPMPVEPDLEDSSISLPQPGSSVVQLVLVDVADPTAPRVLESLEIDGRYVSARLARGTVRLVTASTPQVAGVAPVEPHASAQEAEALRRNRAAAQSVGLGEVLPQAVRRGADGAELASGPAVACGSVQHAQAGASGVSTLLVTTLRPDLGLAALDSTAVTTHDDLVYASAERLYVATSRWGAVAAASDTRQSSPDEVTTEVHAFDTSASDRTPYLGSGSVRGHVYGRWALSEHNGDLRVATTLQPPWDGSGQSSSSIVVLGQDGDRLVERGRVDGLGLDERIFAVRYFGDLATVVTFRETDPLYVLDLSEPTRPRVLGELKIPGFSTYLHPVGDDRLMGVGMDADFSGRVTGFQVSLFDLTDLSNPVQVDRLSLGEGYSPASEDSRAFSYDPASRTALLPFQTVDPRAATGRSSALGIRVTTDFRLEEAGRLDVGPTTAVERVLVGAELSYAVTPQGVVAVQTATLARQGSAEFAGVAPAPREVPLPEPLPEPLPDLLPEPPPGDGGPDGPISILPVEPGLPPDCSTSSDGQVLCPDDSRSSSGAGG